MDDETIELAKAAKEVAKTAGKAITAAEKTGAFMAKVLGEAPSNASALLGGNWLNVKRQEQALILTQKANERLKKRGIENTVAVPMAIGVPIFEKASLEEDENLIDVWANLLTNAMDPKFEPKMLRAYADIISSMEALDVRLLTFLGSQGWEMFNVHFNRQTAVKSEIGPKGYSVKRLSGELGVPEQDIQLSLINLERVSCIISEFPPTIDGLDTLKSGIEVHHKEAIFRPTALGFSLIQACSGEAHTD